MFKIFHKTAVHPSRTTLNNGQVRISKRILFRENKNYSFQIFDEKLNWNARAKVHCWSEIDLRQLRKQKAIVAVCRKVCFFLLIKYFIIYLAIS